MSLNGIVRAGCFGTSRPRPAPSGICFGCWMWESLRSCWEIGGLQGGARLDYRFCPELEFSGQNASHSTSRFVSSLVPFLGCQSLGFSLGTIGIQTWHCLCITPNLAWMAWIEGRLRTTGDGFEVHGAFTLSRQMSLGSGWMGTTCTCHLITYVHIGLTYEVDTQISDEMTAPPLLFAAADHNLVMDELFGGKRGLVDL